MLLELRDLQLYWCGTCNTGNLMQDEVAVIGTDKKTTVCKDCKNGGATKNNDKDKNKS